MSQYANIVAAEQTLPPTPPYYSAGSTPMPMTVPPTQGPHHQSTNDWSQYYTDSSLLPPPSSFPSYVPEAGPSHSTSSYTSSLQNGGITGPLTPVASAISPSGFREITDVNSSQVEYQAQTRSLPFSDYPTSSQRTIVPPCSPRQLTTFPTLWTFGNNRQGSPSSHTSISNYGTGTKGWESSGLNAVEEMRYIPSHVGVVDVDGSSEQVTEAGSRHSSVPASTTTSSSPSVKVEPQDPDDCFVMELPAFSPTSPVIGHSSASRQSQLSTRNTLSRRNLLSQSLAPRTEVPLRATGASEEMRCMMGVFRLNPFAMHSLSNADDKLGDKEGLKELEAYSGEGQPLEEEPLVFEFQLAIDGLSSVDDQEQADESDGMPDSEPRRPPGLESEEESQLRSFSPSFDLHPDDVDGGHDSAQKVSFMSDIAIQGQNQGSDHDHEHEQDQQGEPWAETDCASVSEMDTSSTASCSTYTTLSGSPQSIPGATQIQVGYEHRHEQAYPPSTASVWDAVNEQYQDAKHGQLSSTAIPSPLPTMAKAGPVVYGHPILKVPRLHTTTSHPYLRKSLQNQHALYTHPQSFSYSSPQGYPQAPASPPQPGPSLLHPPARRSHQSHQLAIQQSPIQPRYLPHSNNYEQNHVPPYSHPAQVSTTGASDVQHLVGPVSPAYMRPGRDLRDQELEYEGHAHAYSLRSPDGSVSGYTLSPYTSPPMNVHSGQHTNPPNRRWSLPEAGGSHGYGVGMGGPFLGNV